MASSQKPQEADVRKVVSREERLCQWLNAARCRLSHSDYRNWRKSLQGLHGKAGDAETLANEHGQCHQLASLLWRAEFPEGRQQHFKWISAFQNCLPASLHPHWQESVMATAPASPDEHHGEEEQESKERPVTAMTDVAEEQQISSDQPPATATAGGSSSSTSAVIASSERARQAEVSKRAEEEVSGGGSQCTPEQSSTSGLLGSTEESGPSTAACRSPLRPDTAPTEVSSHGHGGYASERADTLDACAAEIKTPPEKTPDLGATISATQPGVCPLDAGSEGLGALFEDANLLPSGTTAKQTGANAEEIGGATSAKQPLVGSLVAGSEDLAAELHVADQVQSGTTAKQTSGNAEEIGAATSATQPRVCPLDTGREEPGAELAGPNAEATGSATSAIQPTVGPLHAGREELGEELEAADGLRSATTAQQTGANAEETGFQQLPQQRKRSALHIEEAALPGRRARLRLRSGSGKPAANLKASAGAGHRQQANRYRLEEDRLAAKDLLLQGMNAQLLEARAEIAELRDEVALEKLAAFRATRRAAPGAAACERGSNSSQEAATGAPLSDFLAAMAAPAPAPAPKADEQPSCVICRMPPSRPKVAVLCGHFACEECWSRWLALQFSCPICRNKVRPANLVKLKGWGEG